MQKSILTCILIQFFFPLFSQTGWQAISSFGSNPGNLNMYRYVPAGISGKAPLVVVMHGCTENATTYAAQSGWNKLADNHLFYVVYPEQNAANNSSTCFNWFQAGDQNRNQGEAYSIKQMVDYMKANFAIDTTRIFVTGLSAGACMTNVMMACYPDVFKAGAVMAGAPYKAGASALYGYTTTISPQAWGDSVKTAYPGYTGSYPNVAVYQGSADFVVSPTNANEVMKQWTNIKGASQTPALITNSFNGNALITKNTYNDPAGHEVVETYTISGMGHGIALDTGSCYQQGGQAGTYALQVKLFSSFWAANFFNILTNNTLLIQGLQVVSANQTAVSYSVSASSNTSYTWSVPAGASITAGQGTNQINVSFGSSSGNVSVTETNAANCKIGPLTLYVTVGNSTSVNYLNGSWTNQVLTPNPSSGYLHLLSANTFQQVQVFNLLGENMHSSNGSIPDEYIDLTPLPSGIYLVYMQLQTGAMLVQKIILQKNN